MIKQSSSNIASKTLRGSNAGNVSVHAFGVEEVLLSTKWSNIELLAHATIIDECLDSILAGAFDGMFSYNVSTQPTWISPI